MAPIKCCVVGCTSTNKTHRLYNLPKDDKRRALWLSFLVPVNSELLVLSKHQQLNKRVCQKHFDKHQLDYRGNRLKDGYPCLFSAIEIEHGVPLTGDHFNDHNYSKKEDTEEIVENPVVAQEIPSTSKCENSSHSIQTDFLKSQGMDHFEEIPGFRGATRWYQRGEHFFIAFRSSGLSTYLRCHRCPVAWVLRAGQPGPIQGEHDHDPTPWVRNRNNLFQALKRRSSSEATPLSAIYEEEADRYPDAVPYLLYESVVSSMRTWRRRSVVPPVPRTLEANGVALAERDTNSNLTASIVLPVVPPRNTNCRIKLYSIHLLSP